MKKYEITEKLQYISPDGVIHELHDPPKRAVLSQQGWGIPPYIMNTTRGPFQQGETPNIFRLSPRTVAVDIRHNEYSRSDYWGIRSTLVDHLRPNRGPVTLPEPGKLRRIYYENGIKKVRQLDVFLTSGLTFQSPAVNTWDEWAVQETLTFTAYNPIIYDPTQITVTAGSSTGALKIPMTFPFTLGEWTYDFTVNYAGTWVSHPVIVIDGTVNCPTIINNTTGQRIGLDYLSSHLEVITIDLGYDQRTITNNFGQNLMGYLTDTSSLSAFTIEPDPIAASGTNSFTVHTKAGTVNGTVSLKYYTSFIGI